MVFDDVPLAVIEPAVLRQLVRMATREDPAVVFTKMNEEHGYLDVRRAAREFGPTDR